MTKLYVGNLPFSATADLLRYIFEHVGVVRSARISTDLASGHSRGFGFVEMVTPHEADEAISRFDGDTYDGQTVTVSAALERQL